MQSEVYEALRESGMSETASIRLAKALDKRDGSRFDEVLAKLDARFDKIDERFNKVDERFDKVDARFEKVDARFEKVDAQLSNIKSDIVGLKVDTGALKALIAVVLVILLGLAGKSFFPAGVG